MHTRRDFDVTEELLQRLDILEHSPKRRKHLIGRFHLQVFPRAPRPRTMLLGLQVAHLPPLLCWAADREQGYDPVRFIERVFDGECARWEHETRLLLQLARSRVRETGVAGVHLATGQRQLALILDSFAHEHTGLAQILPLYLSLRPPTSPQRFFVVIYCNEHGHRAALPQRRPPRRPHREAQEIQIFESSAFRSHPNELCGGPHLAPETAPIIWNPDRVRSLEAAGALPG